MCYPSPGPLCSSYAALLLTKAKLSFRLERSEAGERAVRLAQQDYDTTLSGMKRLHRKINEMSRDLEKLLEDMSNPDLTDEIDREWRVELKRLEVRLSEAHKRRMERLALLSSKDDSDMPHRTEIEEVMFPERFHTFSQVLENESSIPDDSKMMKKLIDDSSRYTAKLSVDEIEALSWYTSVEGSSTINKYLFHDAESQDHLNTIIKDLDRAISKGKRLTPIKVYRGVTRKVIESEGYKHEGVERYISNEFPIGKNVIFPVFMSSSLEYRTAKSFEDSGVILEILSKTVAPVSNVSAWDTQEKEYILPRNTTYLVQAVKEYGRHLYVVQLEEV